MTTRWPVNSPPEDIEALQTLTQNSIRTLRGNDRTSSSDDLFEGGPSGYKAHATEHLRGDSIVSEQTLEAQVMQLDYLEAVRQVRSYTVDDQEKYDVDLDAVEANKQVRSQTL